MRKTEPTVCNIKVGCAEVSFDNPQRYTPAYTTKLAPAMRFPPEDFEEVDDAGATPTPDHHAAEGNTRLPHAQAVMPQVRQYELSDWMSEKRELTEA